MALNSGFTTFTASMAEAMQNAFIQAWPDYMDDTPVPDPNPQMKLMFVAIARGVVQHLHEHPEAFEFDHSSQSGRLTEIEGS